MHRMMLTTLTVTALLLCLRLLGMASTALILGPQPTPCTCPRRGMIVDGADGTCIATDSCWLGGIFSNKGHGTGYRLDRSILLSAI